MWGLLAGFGMAKLANATVGLRASTREEEEGLDMTYYGIPAYNDLERFADVPSSLYDFEETTRITVAETKLEKVVSE
jgi:ammonium transporter, Amt family